MKYLMFQEGDREALVSGLSAMPDFLTASFHSLSEEEAKKTGPNDTFSPVQQCWHLADLEREGFGVRIRRILWEQDPELPDFDGARQAVERDYNTKSLAAGIQAFNQARADNLEVLRSVTLEQWNRTGRQEGVGKVSLCDIPLMMAEHDAGHRREIEDIARSVSE
ncbi:MAG TPA: DinB family protein [Terriglobia bacterium]|nr:DinB family protein [Terriglobia bacterium]